MNPPEKIESPQARKPYHSPILHYYGAIRAITKNVGSMTNADGGVNPKTKTA